MAKKENKKNGPELVEDEKSEPKEVIKKDDEAERIASSGILSLMK